MKAGKFLEDDYEHALPVLRKMHGAFPSLEDMEELAFVSPTTRFLEPALRLEKLKEDARTVADILLYGFKPKTFKRFSRKIQKAVEAVLIVDLRLYRQDPVALPVLPTEIWLLICSFWRQVDF